MNIYFTGTESRRGLDISNNLDLKYVKSVSLKYKNSRFIILKFFLLLSITFLDYLKIKKLNPKIILYEHAGDFNPIIPVLLYNFFHKCILYVDCHTCVYIDNNYNLVREFFNKLIIKKSKIFIAHNEETKKLEYLHKTMYVLESKIPNLENARYDNLFKKAKFNIVFITRFNDDEPIYNMINSTNFFDESYHFYFTGNFKKKYKENIKNDKITFTGFLSRNDYNNLLKTCDVHVVLTTREYTLLYGGRESISLEKPLVISNNEPCVNYFNQGAIHVNNEPQDIANAIKKCLFEKDLFIYDIKNLKKKKNLQWKKKLKILKNQFRND